MNQLIEFLGENIKWIFSGIGISLLFIIIKIIGRLRETNDEFFNETIVIKQNGKRKKFPLKKGINHAVSWSKRGDRLSELKKLVGSNEIDKVLKELLLITIDSPSQHKIVIGLSARYKRLEQKQILGTSMGVESEKNFNKMVSDTLSLIDSLSNEEIF